MADDAERRRAEAVARINAIDRDRIASEPNRAAFFDAVYDMADGNTAGIPWADLAPKPELVAWLAANPGHGGRAIDVACGLGDNAEALAAAGYVTTAFDGAGKAVEWARRRFPGSQVDYRVADLVDPPEAWRRGFDLVNECYTVQSVPPELHAALARAVADLVAPGGILLVYTRVRSDDSAVSGPPWPLTESELAVFAGCGLELLDDNRFSIERPGRTVSHAFMVFRRPGDASR